MAGASNVSAFRRNVFQERFGEFSGAASQIDETLEEISEELENADVTGIEPLLQSDKSREFDEDKVFGWTATDSPPLNAPFTGTKGLNIEMPDNSQQIDFFELFFDNAMLEKIVENTNAYSQAKIDDKELKKSSRLKRWEPTAVDELRVFFALTIATGLVTKANLPAYWGTDEEVLTPYFSSKISCNRYQAILSNLHIVDNKDDDHTDPLFKIRPFFTHLRRQFAHIYSPDRELSFDEGLCPWKGRLRFRTYNPAKSTRFGIRFYEVCEASTGYVLGMDIYQGATPVTTFCETIDLNDDCIQTTKIVMGILASCGLLQRGHHLYMDNFYTSPELFVELDSRDTYACGTIRRNSSNYPSALKTSDKFQQNEAVYRRHNNMLALRYRDKRDVYMLSTIHSATMTTLSKTDKDGQPLKKPTCIVDYCRFMGGVDLSDQICGNYSTLRKTLKWWRKLFFHLFCTSICNALILYRQYNGDRNYSHYYTFRLALVRQLISKATTAPVPTPIRSRRPSSAEDEPLRLRGRHFPQYIPKAAADRPQPRRDCVACNKPYTYSQREKKTRRHCSVFQCNICQVALCVPRCFEAYHTRVDYYQFLSQENK